MAQAIWKGRVLASTDAPVLFDSNVYFPADAVNWALLEASDHETVCPWKGTAKYYSARVDGLTGQNVAWTYEDPKPEAEAIRGHLAFWGEVTITK